MLWHSREFWLKMSSMFTIWERPCWLLFTRHLCHLKNLRTYYRSKIMVVGPKCDIRQSSWKMSETSNLSHRSLMLSFAERPFDKAHRSGWGKCINNFRTGSVSFSFPASLSLTLIKYVRVMSGEGEITKILCHLAGKKWRHKCWQKKIYFHFQSLCVYFLSIKK